MGLLGDTEGGGGRPGFQPKSVTSDSIPIHSAPQLGHRGSYEAPMSRGLFLGKLTPPAACCASSIKRAITTASKD